MELPPGVGNRFEVYVNGVRQQEGGDFVRRGNELVFPRSLVREGRLGLTGSSRPPMSRPAVGTH